MIILPCCLQFFLSWTRLSEPRSANAAPRCERACTARYFLNITASLKYRYRVECKFRMALSNYSTFGSLPDLHRTQFCPTALRTIIAKLFVSFQKRVLHLAHLISQLRVKYSCDRVVSPNLPCECLRYHHKSRFIDTQPIVVGHYLSCPSSFWTGHFYVYLNSSCWGVKGLVGGLAPPE